MDNYGGYVVGEVCITHFDKTSADKLTRIEQFVDSQHAVNVKVTLIGENTTAIVPFAHLSRLRTH